MKTYLLLFSLGFITPALASTQSIQGNWTSATCESIPNQDGTRTYFKRSFVIDGKNWAIDFSTFGDDKCSAAAKLVTVNIDGPYVLGAASKNSHGATEAEFRFAHRSVTPKAEGALGWLNSSKICGFADWKLGLKKDIHQTGCPQLGSYPLSMCKGEFDIVKTDGKNLYFGARPADGNLCSPDHRPKQVSTAAVVKQ